MFIDNGGPAFPEQGLSGLPNGEFVYGRSGMTLRDYFAAKAMEGMIINEVDATNDALAARSYVMADAMLKARNK